jgi:peptide/nickel transport system permease protein
MPATPAGRTRATGAETCDQAKGAARLLRYTVRRVAIAIPVLVGVTMISYLIINAAPGNAVTMLINPNMSAGDLHSLEVALGLDKPVWVRYVIWLGQLLHGNLGFSFVNFQPVLTNILQRLPATAELMITAIALSYVLAIPLGVVSAIRQFSWIDYASTVTAFLGVSVPSFFIGLILLYIFALNLNILPASGQVTVGAVPTLGDYVTHLILPAITLAFGNMGSTVRYVRQALLDSIRQDYIRTARAKGLGERVVVYKHALRNALLPVITIAGLQVPLLFSGAVITEQVFGWPGIGSYTIQAITQRDYPTIMGITLIAAILVVIGNLVADLCYSMADPRIRL